MIIVGVHSEVTVDPSVYGDGAVAYVNAMNGHLDKDGALKLARKLIKIVEKS